MRGHWQASLMALVLAPVACAQTHGPMSIELRDAPKAASGKAGRGSVEAAGPGGIAHGTVADAGRSAAVHDGGAPEPDASSIKSAADAAQGVPVAADVPTNDETEVWIGQVWSVTPSLCDPNAPWSDTPVVVRPTGYIDRVVLILEHVGDAALQGSIQLGEGALPTSPGDAPYASGDSGSYWLCSIQLPTKGVEYPLLEPVLTSDRLMFEISSSDVWNTWCQTQSSSCPGAPNGTCPPDPDLPVCACKSGTCEAAEHARPAFDLAVTADMIEGQLPFLGGGFGTPAELRLRRAQ